MNTGAIIQVKYQPLESYGQSIFFWLSLCTIHSVKQLGSAPVFLI